MPCHDHPESASVGACAGCAEPFCARCLVTVRGATYCKACKSMAVSGVTSQSVALCADAKTALGLAFLSLFCFGFVLGPVAIAKASGARRQIGNNPALGGAGWANAATVVGIFGLAFSLLGFATRCGAPPFR
jgi:hypothetical protein